MWLDLNAADTVQAAEFYRQLFGWDIADAGVGGYQVWIADGPQPRAGIRAAQPGAVGHWLPYVVVDDLDKATKQAVALGASVISEALDGPAGTSVTIADPGGARLALFTPFPAGR
jgi:predicted enzyme related to lactoylglutathione lyase